MICNQNQHIVAGMNHEMMVAADIKEKIYFRHLSLTSFILIFLNFPQGFMILVEVVSVLYNVIRTIICFFFFVWTTLLKPKNSKSWAQSHFILPRSPWDIYLQVIEQEHVVLFLFLGFISSIKCCCNPAALFVWVGTRCESIVLSSIVTPLWESFLSQMSGLKKYCIWLLAVIEFGISLVVFFLKSMSISKEDFRQHILQSVHILCSVGPRLKSFNVLWRNCKLQKPGNEIL